jgi:CheY-like chemotaxis protein
MKHTVVIIDDDPDDIELMEEALTDIGTDMEVIAFEDCKEAYERITRGNVNPDIILMDINMPLMRGDDCLRLLRADPRFKDVVIAMISTSMPEEQKELLARKGASYVFQKPPAFKQLQTMLADVIRHA